MKVKTFIPNDEEKKVSDDVNLHFQTQKNGKFSKVWEKIQTFYSQQSDFRLKELEDSVREEVKENHPDSDSKEIESIVKRLLETSGFYLNTKEREKYLADKSEVEVDMAIAHIMDGS